MATVTFSPMQLIEDSKDSAVRFITPNPDTFIDLPSSFHEYVDDTYYEVNVLKENDYIWFDIDYGKTNPKDSNITNVITGDKRPNDRDNNEAELISQLFALYKYENNTLYLSNLRKKPLLVTIMEQRLGKNFIIKSYLKNIDEFIAIIKSVDSVSFTEVRDLFNSDSKRRQALKDLTGTDAPDRFSIDAKYTKSLELSNFIRTLCGAKTENKLDDLVVKGIDEDGFEFVFNLESFVNKIHTNSKKNINGKFISSNVRDALLISI